MDPNRHKRWFGVFYAMYWVVYLSSLLLPYLFQRTPVLYGLIGMLCSIFYAMLILLWDRWWHHRYRQLQSIERGLKKLPGISS